MSALEGTFDSTIADIKRLAAAGTLGFYTQAEATEVIAFPPDTSQPINLLTILVAEEHPMGQAIPPQFLNPKRIRLPGLHGWSFGICRYTLRFDQVIPVFERLVASGIWDVSGTELRQSAIAARPPQFVPPNSFQEIPWNHVLKNNFWNGCYVIEWVDTKKTGLDIFFANRQYLQTLSNTVHSFVPIRLASLSDRLGNILIQLPVTVLNGKVQWSTRWHPDGRDRMASARATPPFACKR